MRLALPLLLTAVLLAGCADDDSALPGPTVAPTTAPTTATSAPVVEPVDPLSPRPALESAAPLGGPPCRAADLRVDDADLLASASALQEVFAVRTSGRSCQLRGWPVVRLLGDDGLALPLTARRVGTAKAVSLSRGTSLSFVLSTPRSSSCQNAATLVVRLPGTDRDIRATTAMQVCNRSLQVGPVERRQDDEGAEH